VPPYARSAWVTDNQLRFTSAAVTSVNDRFAGRAANEDAAMTAAIVVPGRHREGTPGPSDPTHVVSDAPTRAAWPAVLGGRTSYSRAIMQRSAFGAGA
jgi:hypothetical protein